ncbi:MAG: hypothetical protein AABX51_02400 [Nanoarchaeota archaeon]
MAYDQPADEQIPIKLDLAKLLAERYIEMYQGYSKPLSANSPDYKKAADHLFTQLAKFDLKRFRNFSERERGHFGMVDYDIFQDTGITTDTVSNLMKTSEQFLVVLKERGLEGFLEYIEGLV